MLEREWRLVQSHLHSHCRLPVEKEILHEKRDLVSFILLSIAKVNKRFLRSSTKRGRGAGG